MKVLVVSQHYWPESFRINEVVESLQEAGCDVTVLSGQPNYPRGEVFPGYRAAGWGVERHPAGYDIYRVPLMPRGPGGALRLIGNYVSFVMNASLFGAWQLRRKRFDVIFVYAVSPILQAIPAILLRTTCRAALVTWVQDLWPQSLEVTGFVRNRAALSAVERVVRWIYRHNDLLLAQSEAFVSTVRALSGGTEVVYHPNPGERAMGKVPAGPAALVLGPGFNVVFAGNLGTVQALETVLDAAEQLRRDSTVQFTLVGDGSRLKWLQDEIACRDLHNVSLPGRYAPDEMPQILAQADALLVSLVRSPIMEQTVPSKVQAYLAAGRPVIASMDGEGARVVQASGAGVACPAEDAAALAEAIRALKSASPEARQAMGDAGRAYYGRHFEPAALASQLVARFQAAVRLRWKGRDSDNRDSEKGNHDN
ncbi:glycosyltransferase family 4 protein [Cupriavidus plantarum]|uniref:glycosyltransferase family 4 protein n=1 Tax=Cupriavidus plantarum TaxID=942865 RepID=UPI000EAF6FB2|nr:glycosyltransferase family 4 protein [Cupriavidus plantarum]NYH98068.1 glycosyltransferase involved in cell wall biosynthesis [Cupriavidus plantarum]RLK35501.1 glycosyltransferase involved in cell wall biosynthesis [Cupriavidus plantarum]